MSDNRRDDQDHAADEAGQEQAFDRALQEMARNPWRPKWGVVGKLAAWTVLLVFALVVAVMVLMLLLVGPQPSAGA